MAMKRGYSEMMRGGRGKAVMEVGQQAAGKGAAEAAQEAAEAAGKRARSKVVPAKVNARIPPRGPGVQGVPEDFVETKKPGLVSTFGEENKKVIEGGPSKAKQALASALKTAKKGNPIQSGLEAYRSKAKAMKGYKQIMDNNPQGLTFEEISDMKDEMADLKKMMSAPEFKKAYGKDKKYRALMNEPTPQRILDVMVDSSGDATVNTLPLAGQRFTRERMEKFKDIDQFHFNRVDTYSNYVKNRNRFFTAVAAAGVLSQTEMPTMDDYVTDPEDAFAKMGELMLATLQVNPVNFLQALV